MKTLVVGRLAVQEQCSMQNGLRELLHLQNLHRKKEKGTTWTLQNLPFPNSSWNPIIEWLIIEISRKCVPIFTILISNHDTYDNWYCIHSLPHLNHFTQWKAWCRFLVTRLGGNSFRECRVVHNPLNFSQTLHNFE